VVILRYQEDMGLREIAEVMEIPINTVKSSIDRALELLRRKLSRSLGGVKV
jgi:DNA-directed RNA polymerase specialized sigma24 family protein